VLRKEGILTGDDRSKPPPTIRGNTVQAETSLLPLERQLIITAEKYPAVIEQAGVEMNPSVVASYSFELAKAFNSFYGEHSIGNAETPDKKALRLQVAQLTANTLRSALGLLGIRVPERM
jgi:arginyl-tRNA synthetase